jgi:hypothetical protein
MVQFSHSLDSRPSDLSCADVIVLNDFITLTTRAIRSVINGQDEKLRENLSQFIEATVPLESKTSLVF